MDSGAISANQVGDMMMRNARSIHIKAHPNHNSLIFEITYEDQKDDVSVEIEVKHISITEVALHRHIADIVPIRGKWRSIGDKDPQSFRQVAQEIADIKGA
jgi:hypothetical protein